MVLDEIDWLRSEFPVVGEMIYLDMAYGNPLAMSVRRAMEAYMEAFQREVAPRVAALNQQRT